MLTASIVCLLGLHRVVVVGGGGVCVAGVRLGICVFEWLGLYMS